MKQLVSIICGFIMPRLFLEHFGSNVNGLIASIGQFLSIVMLFDAGMGVVIEAALYKPLSQTDNKKISQVLTSGKRFYNRVLKILAVYIIIIAFVYPFLVNDGFDTMYTGSLIVIISISLFGQYGLGVTCTALLTADQRGYIDYLMVACTTIINTILCTILINMDLSIQIVKLVSSCVYLFRPVALYIYIKRKYDINWNETYETEPISQKWNGFAQHIAAFITNNTDIVVLTIFSTLSNVSVYSVYFLVIGSLKELLNSISGGIKAIFGDMYAKGEFDLLNNVFDKIEWVFHNVSTIIFSITAVLICPFVLVYTQGINDVSYYEPYFALVLCVAYCAYCIRIPYNLITQSTGFFKQTQISALIEAFLNITISIICINKLGLVGIAIGTLIAIFYRLIYYVIFLKKKILNRSLLKFIKNICMDFTIFVTVFILGKICVIEVNGFEELILYAILMCVLSLVVLCVVNMLFFKDNMRWLYNEACRVIGRKDIKK